MTETKPSIFKAGHDALANLGKLPEHCFNVLLSDPCLVIAVRRGEPGYSEVRRKATPAEAQAFADMLNEGTATKAQAAAMEAGSMFGWHIPAADADAYDVDGKLR